MILFIDLLGKETILQGQETDNWLPKAGAKGEGTEDKDARGSLQRDGHALYLE